MNSAGDGTAKRMPWPHKKMARRLANRKRTQKLRAKYESLQDLVPPQWDLLRRLIGVRFGGDIPDDIKEKFLKWLIPVREDLRKRSGLYDKPRPLIEDVHCKHSFLLESGVNACLCSCIKARHVASARAFVTVNRGLAPIAE
jgi:hypothetical protein